MKRHKSTSVPTIRARADEIQTADIVVQKKGMHFSSDFDRLLHLN